MGKKIYHGDRYIEFADVPPQSAQNQSLEIVPALDQGGKTLKKILRDFTDPQSERSYLITGQDFARALEAMKPKFRYIEAAGGFIEKEQSYLFINRHGRWDLPKGKREKNERIQHCAVRECEEECGVRNLLIRNALSSTFHVYAHKGAFALKQTYWFYMTTSFPGKLTPQLEEDISEVRWFSRQEVLAVALNDTYYTISDVVKEAMNL